MTKITRFALAATDVVSGLVMQLRALGARFRAWLVAHHCAALVAMVEKADAEADSIRRAVDRMRDKAVAAEIKAAQIADDAANEAAKHGVDLEV